MEPVQRRIDEDLASAGSAFLGVVGCLTVASLLSLAHGLGQAVPALALMLVVICAATLGGRIVRQSALATSELVTTPR